MNNTELRIWRTLLIHGNNIYLIATTYDHDALLKNPIDFNRLEIFQIGHQKRFSIQGECEVMIV